MNLLNRLPAKVIRIIFTLLALYALILGGINFVRVMFTEATSNDECIWLKEGRPDSTGIVIRQIVPGGVAEQGNLKDGDILLAIDGNRFRNEYEAQWILNKVGAKETAVYLIERDGKQMQINITITKVFNLLHLSLALLGIVFLIIGYTVGMTKPRESLQQKFYFLGLFMMTIFSAITRTASYPTLNILLSINSLIGLFVLPPLFVHFFLWFPIKREALTKSRWLLPTLYGMSLLNVGIVLIRIVTNVPRGTPDIIVNAVFVLYLLVGFGVYISSYVKIKSKELKKPLSIILWGTAIGMGAIAYLIAISFLLPLSQIVLFHPAYLLPIMLVTALPISFGYAIFKYRLMDIHIIIRKSLVYSLITACIAVIYLVMVFGVGQLLSGLLGEQDNKVMTVLAIVVIAFAFDPIKKRVQDFIDRFFYRERYDYQKTLLGFSKELPRLIDLNKILDSVVETVSKTMHIQTASICLYEKTKDACVTYVKVGTDMDYQLEEHDGSLVKLLKDTRAPQFFYRIKEESDMDRLRPEDREIIVNSNTVLSIPMFLQNRLIGVLNLGPKLSGKIYSEEDVDLLTTVAGQAAIAIENARLHLEELAKQKIEEELRMARKIQQGLLPKENPNIIGLDISGTSIPATTVGGDYFDFIKIDDNHLIVIVGDVSGKGMSAALYMSKIQGMIQLASDVYPSPRDMLVEVNRKIYDGIERNSFITMIVALFDLEKKQVSLCRAGHNPVLLSINGTVSSLKIKGIGLGLEEGSIFEQELEQVEKPLIKGNTYIFYSDGLTEAMTSSQEEFGEQRVMEIAKRSAHLSAEAIQQTLLSEVRDFSKEAEQNDDITIVVVKYP
jgi:sigma-B regulation protein RsbU (phosphoserine phosphatase)